MIDKTAWHVFLNDGSLQMIGELKKQGVDVEHILAELHQASREYYLDQGYSQGVTAGPFDDDEQAAIAFNKGWEHGYAMSESFPRVNIAFDEGLCKGWDLGCAEGQRLGETLGYNRGFEDAQREEEDHQEKVGKLR